MLYPGDVPQGVDVDSIAVAGLYGKVYLLDDVDLATPEGRAVLLHELVHHLQYRHGLDKSAPCVSSLEQAAYTAQRRYLEQHGKNPS